MASASASNLWRRRRYLCLLAAVLGSRAASRAFGAFGAPGHSRPSASALTRSPLARATAAPRSTRTARPSLVTGPQLLFPVFASALFLGVEAARQANDGAALKDLIQKYTNIIVKDAPDGVANMPPADKDGVYWYVKDPDVYRRVLVQGDLGLGESYMDGLWESNDVEAFVREMIKLEPVKKDLGVAGLPLLASAVVGTLSWLLFPGNSPTGAKENIAKHYDISLRLYEQMLGPTMQYSGAYYHKPGMSLTEAQLAKMRLVAEKLDLKPGMKVLELGCGFGALADLISTEYGVHVTGVTLSEDQYAYAKEHFRNPAVDIRLQDYRSMTGQFDRIYSVGIFEHIGRNCYQTYFDKCYELLKDNGIMVIHSIGFARRGEWNHGGWMNKYIFPGAELPTMSHFTQEFNDRWHMEDWQSFGVSYAKTLREWKHRLDNWKGLEEFEVRFRRMWEYYLDCCAASFEARRTKLWQIVYTKMPAATQREDDCHHIRQPMISSRPKTASCWNTE
eukprot:CAMPEP_0181405216 /NCGR_PEP_ID=MMETSP1110-20121109/4647_1 /TAXON_ID=174948 /ORGANISM="Symbiodinium sp., Strain CCMP421" /LENGTH=504 /DNA_ID=CAMNT_0023527601 /DNA_START=31 /DNA_END=1542 /DNA_ORIENTATION=-